MFTTTKGLTRRFRKALHPVGIRFPLTGPFVVRIGDNLITDPTRLPKLLPSMLVECVVGMLPSLSTIPTVQAAATVPTLPTMTATNPDRQLYRRVVRVSEEKRRVDYRPVRNPKGGELYWAKIDGKWREVPALYADPEYQLPVEKAKGTGLAVAC